MGRCLLLLLLVVPAAGRAQPAVPPLTGRVVDRAEVLSPATEGQLTALLEAHEQATTNQVVVLTIPSLEGSTVEEVANAVFNAWGLGQAGRDNGVLLLVAHDDRELRIEVGYGLEGALTDAEAGRIIRHVIVPRFREGDFDGGVMAGVTAILGTIEGTYEAPEDTEGEDVPIWFGLVFLVTHGLLPLGIALRALVEPPGQRYATFAFTLLFIGFALAALPAIVFGPGAAPVGLGLLALYVAGFFAADVYMARAPKWKAIRARVRAARKSGRTTRVDAGWISFSAGGSSRSGSSGGGGFSGGGGSSGGGGASGSW
jgi:uncharacterized protein